jgi:hypothetical protein
MARGSASAILRRDKIGLAALPTEITSQAAKPRSNAKKESK